MSAIVRTHDLPRLLADCTQRLGFVCHQQIPGVLALVSHGPLQLQLWACGARPGRWEQPEPAEEVGAAEQISVVVSQGHALRASLHRAAQRHAARADPAAERSAIDLPSGPQLQPWGAWEFALPLANGHVVHCVDWTTWHPADLPQRDESHSVRRANP